MPADEQYRRQVELLVRTLPYVGWEECFALKSGTAINLFVRDLPRLSVDIDLTYLPVAERERSLKGIEAALRRVAERVECAFSLARVQAGVLREEGTVNKLFVRERDAQVKIEITPAPRPDAARAGALRRAAGDAEGRQSRRGRDRRHGSPPARHADGPAK